MFCPSEPISFVVKGVPIAKGRPRFDTRGKFPRAYTPEKTRAAEKAIAHSARQWFTEPLTEPLAVNLVFYMPIPKSTSKKQAETLNSEPHTKKPDLDNLQKLVMDALNGIAWKDDSQVFKVFASKVYGRNPQTIVSVIPYIVVE